MKRILLLIGVVWFAVGVALAADRASEDDMFGGVSSTPNPSTPKASAKATQDAGADSRGLEPGGFGSNANKSEEILQIGGTLSTEADFYIQDGVPFFSNTTSNPNILFLYLDSKLESDSRVFAR
ncbi:MAG TPA: hypothetical protein VIJ93_11925, partial [bacterium]